MEVSKLFCRKPRRSPVITYVNGIEQEASAATIDTSSETTYIITYSASDVAGNLATVIRSVIVGGGGVVASGDESGAGDTTSPVVTLIGEAAMEITVGGTFTDPGATALDPSTDGSGQATDLTAAIVVTGAVDTATEGLYTLTYTATDTAGNIGTVSRVVTVIAASTEPTP